MKIFKNGDYDDQIISLCKLGYSDQDIANQFGCSHNTIFMVRKRLGISSTRNMDPGQLKSRIRKMVIDGCTDKQICERLKIRLNRVREYRKQMELAENKKDQDNSDKLDDIDENEIDRRIDCYWYFCFGYNVDDVHKKTNYDLEEIKKFAKEMPNWWYKELMRDPDVYDGICIANKEKSERRKQKAKSG